MTEIALSTGEAVLLIPAPVKKFRGTRLPGADLFQAEQEGFVISIHNFAQELFRFSLRSISCDTGQIFTIRESSKYLRLETVVTGELSILEPNGVKTKLLAGQYRITDTKAYQTPFEVAESCVYFVVFISPQLIAQTPMGETIVPSAPRMMARPMRDVISRILDNPFEDRSRDGFYDWSIRELLFYHVSAPIYTLPGDLTPADIAAVYAADQIIASNLNVHYSIHELARMVKTNVDTLKKGFARIFGMGTFERLLQRKMDRAKYLLETTDMQIQDVSVEAGYITPTGFINAFRKQFKMTPKDWRKKSWGLL